MKISNVLMICGMLTIMSCANDVPPGIISLGQVDLSQEAIEYFDYYESIDKIVLQKLPDPSTDLRITPVENEYWIFEKEGYTAVEYVNNTEKVYSTGGKFKIETESRYIEFTDNHGHKLTARLLIDYDIDTKNGEHKVSNEAFELKYSEPCSVRYIHYRMINNGDANKLSYLHSFAPTILVNQMVVGEKNYHNVMKVENRRYEGHYEYYATKDDGIIRIDDLHTNETWDITHDYE